MNQATVSKIFVEQNSLSPVDYNLSQGFGLTYLNFYFDFGRFSKHLLYAVIDSIEYGNPVDNLPNQNEPVLNDFHLHQNYPNPFNSTTIIPYELPQRSKIEITIYDVSGRKIRTLLSGEMNRGTHSITWNGTNQNGQPVSSGVYFYTLKATALNNSSEAFNESSKLLLLR